MEILLPYWMEPLIAEAVNHRLGRDPKHRVTSDDIMRACPLDPQIWIRYTRDWNPGDVLHS
jgi:hypothetical protein